MGKDHDALFKISFGSKEAAQSQLRVLLPQELLADLDLSTLELRKTDLTGDGLNETPCDRLYSVRLQEREALIYVLHEHQSTPDPLMPFRLLRYLVRVWEWWLEQEQERTGTKPQRLPAIVPVVLYHGVKQWDVARRFLELIDLPERALASVRQHLPEFEFVLDDLSQLTDEELRARGAPALASITLLLFKHGRQGEDLLSVWRSFMDLLGELAQAQDWTVGLRAVTRYTYRVGEVPYEDLAKLVEEAMGPEAKEVVMTTAERLIKQGEKRGEKRGLLKGRLEGERRVLRRLILKRFEPLPADAEQRIASATERDLETWTDRVLGATNLAEVFAE